jgi:hypothetical protein
MRFQCSRPKSIFCFGLVARMGVAVHLDDKSCMEAEEVHDIVGDGDLPSELGSHAAGSEQAPQEALWGRLVAA